MDAHELRVPPVETGARGGPEWADRATAARRQEWSADRAVDQGDTHHKGEASLCVGEAA
jgi:hypothetical protein